MTAVAGVVIGPTREEPLPSALFRIALALKIPDHEGEREPAGCHRDLVAAWEDGSSIRPDGLSRMFRVLAKQSGLRQIRLHDLRHTHATLALQAGIPVPVVSERLGHHSPAFTLAQYAHAIPGMQAVAAAAIADLVRSAERP